MPSSRPASSSPRQKNSAAIGPVGVIEELTDAWIHKDLRGMSRQLTDDITELGPASAKPLVGKRNFFKKYKVYSSSSLRIESYRMLRRRLIRLTPQLVLIHFRYRMKTSNRDSVEKSSGQESMLVERRRGRWLVKFIHWHRD